MEAALRAEHWLLSEKPAKAAKAWLSAGKDLMERGLLEDALEVLNLAKKNSFGTELYDKAILLLCETTFQQANYKLSHQYCIELLDSSLKDVKAAALDLKARILLKDGQVEAAETYITQGLVLKLKV